MAFQCENIDSRDKSSSTEECYCIAFMPDGKSLISGWSDGKIRAFGPQSGKLLYTIHDAHPQVRVNYCASKPLDKNLGLSIHSVLCGSFLFLYS